MQRLTRVGVFSLGKVMGMAGLLIGVVLGIPYGLFIMIVGVGGGLSGQEGAEGVAAVGLGAGIAAMLCFPIFYAVVSFFGGLIYGLILNVVFRFAGGLEIQLEG